MNQDGIAHIFLAVIPRLGLFRRKPGCSCAPAPGASPSPDSQLKLTCASSLPRYLARVTVHLPCATSRTCCPSLTLSLLSIGPLPSDARCPTTNPPTPEITRLQKSLEMLRSTNATLVASLPPSTSPETTSPSLGTAASSSDPSAVKAPSSIDPISPDDVEEFLAVIRENDEAIAAQEERVDMCKHSLMKRIGFDPANKHYDLRLDPDTTAINLVRTQPFPREGSDVQNPTSSITTVTSDEHPIRPEEDAPEDGRDGLYL